MKASNLPWRIGENPDSMVEKHDASCLRGRKGKGDATKDHTIARIPPGAASWYDTD